MATDAFEMSLVHTVFRCQLNSAPRLICDVRPGRPRQLNRVADHIANVMSALHHHHLAEDELLWPVLRDRIPQRAKDIQQMETEHELIATSATKVQLLLADWVAAADPTNAAHGLVRGVRELADLVDAHLANEEQQVLPLINENITDDEWRAVTERGGSFIGPRNMRFGIAFVGMVLEACTADERRRFLAGMPPPQRLLARLFARRASASYHARLAGTPRG